MSRKIIKIGDSVGITLPKDKVKKLGLKAGDRVEVSLDEDSRTFKAEVSTAKKNSQYDERIAELTKNFIERYRSDLEALARK